MILIDCMENSTAASAYLAGGFFIMLVTVVWIAAGKIKGVEE